MSVPEPFGSDAEYLDALWALFSTRARRLALARQRRQADDDAASEWPRRQGRRHRPDDEDDDLERLAMLTAREERQASDIEGRLRAHRADPKARRLGLDRLAMAHDLGEQERNVLALATCFALSEDLAEFVCADLGTGFSGNGSVEFYSRFLGCDSTEDRVRIRRIFSPSAPLVKAGLITLDRMRNESLEPEDLLWCRPRITQSAFDTIVGAVPGLALVEVQE
ncbi:MAG: hypothetical protein AMXMBFR64_39640 [Myxococcales bacterium]